MKITLLTGIFTVALGIIANAQDGKSNYKIANKIHIDGDEGWDYTTVDEDANTLYLSHGSMVQVVDLNTAKVIATIPDTKGVHGIALAKDLNKGFISDGKDTAITIFDMKTYAPLAKVKVTGQKPDAIIYDKATQRVFTFNGKSNNATAIDAKTNAVVGTIALEGKPEFAVADGKGKLYLNLEDKNIIVELDANTLKVTEQWSILPGEGASGLAMDTKNRRLFAVCDNNMMVVMNADNGKVVTTLPIGNGPDAAAFDPEKMYAYSSNGQGTLTVVKEESADKFTVLENVTTQKGARTMAINTKTHHLYLPTAEFMPATPAKEGEKPAKPKMQPRTFMVLDVEPLN